MSPEIDASIGPIELGLWILHEAQDSGGGGDGWPYLASISRRRTGMEETGIIDISHRVGHRSISDTK